MRISLIPSQPVSPIQVETGELADNNLDPNSLQTVGVNFFVITMEHSLSQSLGKILNQIICILKTNRNSQ